MHRPPHCGQSIHFHRRNFLRLLGLSGLNWLTPLGEAMAQAAPDRHRPQSLILLWLDGGPSQLETFDPHPNRAISNGTAAIATSVKGIHFAAGLPKLAEEMKSLAIVRNVVSREGDHERATYNLKTGYRPDPTLVHPAIGAILAHQLDPSGTEIPRHVSILPGAWPGRGGYLGDQFDAFKTDDPMQPVPDVNRRVPSARFNSRLDSLAFMNRKFSQGRAVVLESGKTLHQSTIERAVQMMSSEQLEAFAVSHVPRAQQELFGDTPFGRGCLAAARLVQQGVRCVEVTLSGWDLAHVSNHPVHERLTKTLDAGFSGLLRYLRDQESLEDTLILCCGEFGRTPQLNPAAGRDHWPHGFSIALAGGGIRKGIALGQTDPSGGKVPYEQGVPVADIHATVMHCLGVDPRHELDTPVNRPMKLSEGRVVQALCSA